MINLPRISLSRPSFSSRFFIYFLFGLIILVLLVEGGYYYFSQRKKGARPVNTVWDAVWGDLIEGQITEIKGRTLMVTVRDNSFIPKKVEIEVVNDAEISISPSDDLLKKSLSTKREEFMELVAQWEVARQSILFADLKVGDIIQAGGLTKLARTKFKAETITVMNR